MSHTDDQGCEIHRSHSPNVHEPDVHHVWPRYAGGPDVADNRIVLCPTGHRNVHELIREYEKYDGEPPWSVRQHYGPAERWLARRAWEQMAA